MLCQYSCRFYKSASSGGKKTPFQSPANLNLGQKSGRFGVPKGPDAKSAKLRDGSLRCDMYEIFVGLQCSPGPSESGNALPDMGKWRLFGEERHIRGTNVTQKGKQGIVTAHK